MSGPLSAQIADAPCAAGWRTMDRVERLERDFVGLCDRLEKQTAVVVAGLSDLRAEIKESADRGSATAIRAEKERREEMVVLAARVSAAQNSADTKRTIVGSLAALTLTLAAALLVAILKGCAGA